MTGKTASGLPASLLRRAEVVRAESTEEVAHREFARISGTRQVEIPETLEETAAKLDGLGGLMTASEWARAAMVRAWVTKGTGGPRTARGFVQLSIRAFAEKGIHGLSTQDAVRHYYNAWEWSGFPIPTPGEVVDLPGAKFPEWGTPTKTRERREMGLADPDDPATATWEVIPCSCADLPGYVSDVDVIITDPPYPYEFIETYTELSATAAAILKPGGLLVALAGESYLPEVMARLGEHLDYHWTVAHLTPGGQAVQIWDRKVNTFWKPALVFRNGEYDGAWFGDVTKSAVNDNAAGIEHKWGQSLSGMSDLVSRFSEPGDLVVDPFLGSGTVGFAATRLGRRFVGCDVDRQAVDLAKARLHGAPA